MVCPKALEKSFEKFQQKNKKVLSVQFQKIRLCDKSDLKLPQAFLWSVIPDQKNTERKVNRNSLVEKKSDCLSVYMQDNDQKWGKTG